MTDRAGKWSVLYSFVQPHLGVLALVTFGSVVATALSLSYPAFAMFLIDDVFIDNQVELLPWLAGGMFLFSMGGYLFGSTTGYVYASVSTRVLSRMRHFFFEHVIRLPVRFHRESERGDVFYRLNSDISEIQSAMMDLPVSILTQILTLLIATSMLLYFDAGLFGLCALFIVPSLFTARLFRGLVRSFSESLRRQNSSIASYILESLSGVEVVKTFTREPVQSDRFWTHLDDLVTKVLAFERWNILIGGISTLLMSVGSLFLFWYGGWLVATDQMSIGALVAFGIYLGKFYSPLQGLAGVYLSLQRTKVSFDRVFEVLELEAESIGDAGPVWHPTATGISLHGLTFRYSPGGPEVLSQAEGCFPAGSVTAIRGRSGIGKTTLLNLLLRFFPPGEGQLRIGGRDVVDIPLRELRGNVAYVPQDTFLFGGSVGDNIAVGRPGATAAEIRAAARLAQAHEFVSQLPDGYDSLVGEGGATLSEGQRQRLSLARAFLKDAPVVVLDEATSALDAETESALLEGLASHAGRKTVIIVSHRESLLQWCDRLYSIERGRLVLEAAPSEGRERDGREARRSAVRDRAHR